MFQTGLRCFGPVSNRFRTGFGQFQTATECFQTTFRRECFRGGSACIPRVVWKVYFLMSRSLQRLCVLERRKMKKTTVSDKVYALISSSTRAFSTREILSWIPAGESSIKKALHELTVSKKISKVRHGVYVDPSSAWIYEK